LEDLPLNTINKAKTTSSSNTTTIGGGDTTEPQRTPDWVSPATWKLIDQRATLKRQGTQGQEVRLKELNNNIRKSIKQDRKTRTMKAGEEIETMLKNKDIRGAWSRLKRWYKQVTGRNRKPSPMDMATITATYKELYAMDNNLDNNVPIINYIPTPINDDVPSDVEIRYAVTRLKRWKAPGPTGLRTEELQYWEQNKENTTNWDNLVKLIQHIFRSGEVPQRLCYCNLVIIPKSDGGHRGIGLLEPIWKVISSIIRERCNYAINFEDSLHGFRAERGTSTAILEAKLRMQTRIAEGKTMFQVFLDLSKAYDTVDRRKLIHVLKAYGLGTNTTMILENFWNQLWVIPKQGGFYGRPFKSDRGVTQGDPLSPTLFNVIVDVVVRETKRIMHLTDNDSIFYADDGLVTGTNRDAVQYCLNLITQLFALFGLQINASKTKVLVGRPRIANY
jgi:Reverse transcriptase (RNA-dependent DNA polymerase)